MASMNSPVPSILKTPSLKDSAKRNAAQQVRFDSTATLDVIAILKDFIDGRSNEKYSRLLGLKKDPNVNVSPCSLFSCNSCCIIVAVFFSGFFPYVDSSTSQ